MRTANGEYKWLLDRGRVIERAPDGAPRKVAGISLDIDGPPADGNRLARGEERFRGAFELRHRHGLVARTAGGYGLTAR